MGNFVVLCSLNDIIATSSRLHNHREIPKATLRTSPKLGRPRDRYRILITGLGFDRNCTFLGSAWSYVCKFEVSNAPLSWISKPETRLRHHLQTPPPLPCSVQPEVNDSHSIARANTI